MLSPLVFKRVWRCMCLCSAQLWISPHRIRAKILLKLKSWNIFNHNGHVFTSVGVTLHLIPAISHFTIEFIRSLAYYLKTQSDCPNWMGIFQSYSLFITKFPHCIGNNTLACCQSCVKVFFPFVYCFEVCFLHCRPWWGSGCTWLKDKHYRRDWLG